MRAERHREASVEDVVAGLVAELRPVAGTDPTRDARLMDLGLDSLACADLAIALEHRFGVGLADNDVTGHSTIAEVAATVRHEMPTGRRIPVGLGGHQRLGKGLAGPVRVELLAPAHLRGVSAEAVEVTDGKADGVLTLRFAADARGPYNAPLVIRATARDGGDPVVAETRVEVLPPRR